MLVVGSLDWDKVAGIVRETVVELVYDGAVDRSFPAQFLDTGES